MTKSLNLARFAKLHGDTDHVQFELGDILVAEFGEAPPPNIPGQRDGSRNSLVIFANDLAEEYDIHYEIETLAKLRVVATNFPRESRDSHLSWSIHRIAGLPEMLDMIKDKTVQLRQKLTMKLAEDLKKIIEAELKGVSANDVLKALGQLRFWLKNWKRIEFKLGEAERVSFKEDLVMHQNEVSKFLKEFEPENKHLKVVGELI
jgi:hypothetical protein